MRLTARVAGAGSNGITRMPFLDIKGVDEDLCTDGKLDEAKCRHALSIEGGVQISNDDNLPVFAFTVELMWKTQRAIDEMYKKRKNSDGDTINLNAHASAECPDDKHADRNLRKGRYVFVRTDINYSNVTKAIKMRLDIQNPREVVGVAERIAMDYALIQARIANYIASELTKAGCGWAFEFKGGPGCPDVFSDARQIDIDLAAKKEARKANDARLFCERRTANGYCCPCKFDCPNYKNGKCVEV